METLALAIDFGSSNTAAAYRDRDGAVHEVRLTAAGALMPSAVLYDNGRILVGRTALQAAFTAPDAFEPSPKRRMSDGQILLAGKVIEVTKLVAAVFREVLERARQVMGSEPDEVILTHPEQWAAPLKKALATAAIAAGVKESRLQLVSEPQAAAWFYTASAPDLEPLARLAVFDFGAGTCDVAALDRQPDNSFVVVASEGVEGLGGQDLDARIYGWVRRQLAVRDTALLGEVDNPGAIGTRMALMDRIREAKEALSDNTSAAIAVVGAAGTQVLQLTRDEFDSLIGADIGRAVDLTKRVLDAANDRSPTRHTPTIYLTGGSSHIPLVHIQLGQLAPLGVLGDPKTVVSQGALQRPPPTSEVDETPGPPMDNAEQSEPPPEPPADSRAGTTCLGPPGGDSPRRLKRRMIVGAVGAVAVAIAVVAAMTVGHHGRGPTAVRPSQLDALLLSAHDIGAVVGASNITVDQSADALSQPVDAISDDRCSGAMRGVQQGVYQGSGYSAVSAQFLRAPDNAYRVDQAAVSYPWAALAEKFLKKSTDNWKACAGRSITVTGQGNTDRWVIGDLTNQGDLITQESSKEAGKGWACQHALRAVSNVIIDVTACSYDVQNQAALIADKMATKISR